MSCLLGVSLLSQLKTGFLPLAIKVGRFKMIEEEKRLFKLRNLGEVESEFYFLFVPYKL